MASLPHICSDKNCLTLYFASGIGAVSSDKPGIASIPVGTSGGMGFGNCPVCGGPGTVLPGQYAIDYKDNDTDNPARLLAGPLSTKNVLEQAQNIMAALRQTKQDQTSVIAALETVSPAIAKISRETAGTINYKDWTNLIIALLALLIAIQQAYFKKDDSSDIKREYIDYLLKENEELKEKQAAKAILKRVPKPTRRPVARQTPKPGPNQPCPCGSGKKFKRCHGTK